MGLLSFLCRKMYAKEHPDKPALETSDDNNGDMMDPRNPSTVSIIENVFNGDECEPRIMIEEKKFCNVYGIWRLVHVSENGDVIFSRDANDRERDLLSGYETHIKYSNRIVQV